MVSSVQEGQGESIYSMIDRSLVEMRVLRVCVERQSYMWVVRDPLEERERPGSGESRLGQGGQHTTAEEMASNGKIHCEVKDVERREAPGVTPQGVGWPLELT